MFKSSIGIYKSNKLLLCLLFIYASINYICEKINDIGEIPHFRNTYFDFAVHISLLKLLFHKCFVKCNDKSVKKFFFNLTRFGFSIVINFFTFILSTVINSTLSTLSNQS